jgi:hypothetical protein
MNAGDDPFDGARRTIDSRGDFVAALHELSQLALQQGTPRMLWADDRFAEWPLDDAVLLETLSAWLKPPQRRLVLLANDFVEVQRWRPRFVAWYRLWSHAVTAYSPAEDAPAALPSLAWAEGSAMVHLSDPERWRGWIGTDAATLRQWRDRIDAVLQRSVPAFPATTLGL